MPVYIALVSFIVNHPLKRFESGSSSSLQLSLPAGKPFFTYEQKQVHEHLRQHARLVVFRDQRNRTRTEHPAVSVRSLDKEKGTKGRCTMQHASMNWTLPSQAGHGHGHGHGAERCPLLALVSLLGSRTACNDYPTAGIPFTCADYG